jgi:hypothetical protein
MIAAREIERLEAWDRAVIRASGFAGEYLIGIGVLKRCFAAPHPYDHRRILLATF